MGNPSSACPGVAAARGGDGIPRATNFFGCIFLKQVCRALRVAVIARAPQRPTALSPPRMFLGRALCASVTRR